MTEALYTPEKLGQELTSPAAFFVINNNDVPEEVLDDVTYVAWEDVRDAANLIELKVSNSQVGIANPLGGTTPFIRYVDSTVFAEGNKIDLYMGWTLPRQPNLLFKDSGVITKWLPNFTRSGIPTITIKAYGYEYAFMRTISKGRQFPNTTASDAVDKVFSQGAYRSNMKSEITPTTIKKSFVQKKGESDWSFIKRLARLNGFVVRIVTGVATAKEVFTQMEQPSSLLYSDYQVGNTYFNDVTQPPILYWGPEFEQKNVAREFAWGMEKSPDTALLSFTPSFNTTSQPSSLVVTAYTERDKKPILVEIEPGEKKSKITYQGTINEPLPEIENGPSMSITAFGDMKYQIKSKRFKNEAEAVKYAEEWWKRNKENFLTGNAVFGMSDKIERLRSGQLTNLTGIGTRLSGLWYIDRAKHVITNGEYTVSADVRKKVIE